MHYSFHTASAQENFVDIIGSEFLLSDEHFEQILDLSKDIINEAKNGFFKIAFMKLTDLEKLGVGSLTIYKIIDVMFETKQNLSGLPFTV